MVFVIHIWILVLIICLSTQITKRQGTAMYNSGGGCGCWAFPYRPLSFPAGFLMERNYLLIWLLKDSFERYLKGPFFVVFFLPRSAIMQNRVFTPFLLRFWKWTMKSESFSNAVLHFDKFYLKYRKLKRFEQWRTHAVCCRHLPTTSFCIFLECWRFLDQNEIFKKHWQNTLNTELQNHLI